MTALQGYGIFSFGPPEKEKRMTALQGYGLCSFGLPVK